FGAEHANVQPHAGAQANMGAYAAVLDPGDTILSLSLDHGGHLTHGLKVNFSGWLYTIVHYGVSRETMVVDYDEVFALAKEHRPKLIICGGSAYPRVVEADRFREIADEVGAYLLCDMAHFSGLVAAGLHPDPVPHCDFVTSTTHKTLARRHRHAPPPGRPAAFGVGRKAGAGPARGGQDHGEPEHRAVRRAAADGRLGRAARDAGGDDARLRRGGLPRGRLDHRRRAPDRC